LLKAVDGQPVFGARTSSPTATPGIATGQGNSDGARIPWLPAPGDGRTPEHFHTAHAAFTLVELMVVVAIIAVLAALILPALAGAKARGVSTACLSQLKQLQTCWQMYVDDHGGAVPPNCSVLTNGAWRSTPDSWIGNSSAPHDATTAAIEAGLLFKYDYNRSTRLYRCPADKSRARALDGTSLAADRTRSYSMNGNLGGRTNEVQATVSHASAIPDPSRLFVFLDEHEDSIDDAHFLVWPAPDDRWVNLPADRHSQGANLSFADGHVEHWRWRHSKRFTPRESYWKRAENAFDFLDLQRLRTATVN
jgi:prepilin-type N-terminal cleavage/methylation domain-containing protein/prepilin-type processing-associated H-X9-DG protein